MNLDRKALETLLDRLRGGHWTTFQDLSGIMAAAEIPLPTPGKNGEIYLSADVRDKVFGEHDPEIDGYRFEIDGHAEYYMTRTKFTRILKCCAPRERELAQLLKSYKIIKTGAIRLATPVKGQIRASCYRLCEAGLLAEIDRTPEPWSPQRWDDLVTRLDQIVTRLEQLGAADQTATPLQEHAPSDTTEQKRGTVVIVGAMVDLHQCPPLPSGLCIAQDDDAHTVGVPIMIGKKPTLMTLAGAPLLPTAKGLAAFADTKQVREAIQAGADAPLPHAILAQGKWYNHVAGDDWRPLNGGPDEVFGYARIFDNDAEDGTPLPVYCVLFNI